MSSKRLRKLDRFDERAVDGDDERLVPILRDVMQDFTKVGKAKHSSILTSVGQASKLVRKGIHLLAATMSSNFRIRGSSRLAISDHSFRIHSASSEV